MAGSNKTLPIRVLIVDDSALMRQMLTSVLSSDPDIVVVDTASDPIIAREKIKTLNPDVITLDVEMPRMNGLEFLQKIMTLRPMPVIMISSLTQAGAETSLKALEIGAFDVVGKPSGFIADGMSTLQGEITAKVKAAAKGHIALQRVVAPGRPKSLPITAQGRVITIGASTGGIPAIGSILAAMPTNAPPIVITQHMPETFTSRFAARLNQQCAIAVSEAQDGDVLKKGHAYIAPGGRMLRVKPSGGGYAIVITHEAKVSGFCPSVDVMFDSVAQAASEKAIGVILTGMGSDGAKGLLRLRQSGATTIGQDEASCVVYGMPRVAFEAGAVVDQLSLTNIPQAILAWCAADLKAGGKKHAAI